jgi:SnoaL-like protein
VRAEEAVRRWIEGWQRGWPARDVDGIAARYRDDAPYRSHPFRQVDDARSYLARAFGEEELIEAWFGEPVVAGERAAVEYWASLRGAEDRDVTIAGVSCLRFDGDGLVVEHRDYWVETDGVRTPPSGWGR